MFESLLSIETLAELKLTLSVLAKVTRSGEDCPTVTYAEFQSLTKFSPATITKGLADMQARGYILRHTGKRKQAARYQVLWDKIGTPTAGCGASATPLSNGAWSAKVANTGSTEYYFTATGFLDLLPQARDIARSLGYGEEEVIHAAGLVFDQQRIYPPTINRTGWFTTVFTEKIKAAHAEIQAHRARRDRLTGYSQWPNQP